MHISEITICAKDFPAKDVYPFNIEAISATSHILLTHPVTFFIGENGSGKSTLLEAIARRCNIYIWGGSGSSVAEPNRYEKELYKYIKVKWDNQLVPGAFFGAEYFKHYASIIDDWATEDPEVLKYFGGESLLTKSHGESNLAYFENRFKLKGIYFLDEPESALSPKSQIKLLNIVRKAADKGNTQFLITTHSPILLGIPGASILYMNSSAVESVSYEETEYYTIYKDFLLNREKYV